MKKVSVFLLLFGIVSAIVGSLDITVNIASKRPSRNHRGTSKVRTRQNDYSSKIYQLRRNNGIHRQRSQKFPNLL